MIENTFSPERLATGTGKKCPKRQWFLTCEIFWKLFLNEYLWKSKLCFFWMKKKDKPSWVAAATSCSSSLSFKVDLTSITWTLDCSLESMQIAQLCELSWLVIDATVQSQEGLSRLQLNSCSLAVLMCLHYLRYTAHIHHSEMV